MTVSEIISAAKELSEDDRRVVIRELQETLPADDQVFELHPDWLPVIERRAAEMREHPERAVSWRKVYEESLAKIARHVGQ